ncbi:MAG: hypothetical protein M1839_008374 [Geoglossum umbratile]|nr:MAG: hypothetical protein M1839_008374 [Geoglossum umbratile]
MYGEAPKLTAANYRAWSGPLSPATSGRLVLPPQMPAPAPMSSEDNRDDYRKRCRVAGRSLYLSCSTEIRGLIPGFSDPKAMWQTLEGIVGHRDDSLYREEWDSKGSISEFISKAFGYRERLAHTARPLTEEEVVLHLVSGLTESQDFVRAVILHLSPKDNILDRVINTLTNYEKRLQRHNEGKMAAMNATTDGADSDLSTPSGNSNGRRRDAGVEWLPELEVAEIASISLAAPTRPRFYGGTTFDPAIGRESAGWRKQPRS